MTGHPDMGHPLLPETPKVEYQSRKHDMLSEEGTYGIPTNVEVEGSYLPTGLRTTSSSALNMVKQGTMTATTTSLIVEDAGKGVGHSGMRKDDGEYR